MTEKRRIHFEPDNIDVVVDEGTNLLEAAIRAGVPVYASCGGAGTCGTCKVQINKGEVKATRTARVSDREWEQGIRQACQSQIITDLTVHLLPASRLEKAIMAREKKTAARALAAKWQFRPPLTKLFVELPAPTIDDNVSDLSRLLRGLKQKYKLSNMTVDFEVVRKLPQTLRDGNWNVTVTTLVTAVEDHATDRQRSRLVNIEAGDTRANHYSLAFDIGTTTVWGQVLDLNRGKILAESMEYNGQIGYGADVITRIAHSQKPGGLKALQRAVVKTINKVLRQLLAQCHVEREQIGHLMLAGNTTMTQILLGIDPKYIRLAPYTPVATYVPPVKANSLGIELGDHVYLFTFPSVASYVGGDIISGIVASGTHQTDKITFYMDIGTNGEIVIGNSEWMVTAACSAGPAFEGGGVKHGMVAITGAIEGFSIDHSTLEPSIATIGGEKPKGICGSGLMNIVAGLLEAGVLSQNGKFNADLPTNRIREGAEGRHYVLAWAPETQINEDIIITESDIDNFIRAKAAMYAGFQTLVKSVGLSSHDIEQVILAGAFGSHLEIDKAITVGLLPELPLDKFVFIGNGSLMGARLTSFSTDIMDDARRVAKIMTNFELSENVAFMDNYVAALFLPHTHCDEFPAVCDRLATLVPKQLKEGATA